MKIGFDARMLTHPGIGTYTRCLLREAMKEAPDDEFILFGDPELVRAEFNFPNMRAVKWNAPVYSVTEQVNLPYKEEDLDVLHVPHFNIPLAYRGRMVVTVHDLIYLLFPGSLSNPLGKYYAKFMIGRALRKADTVISVSRNTRDDIAKFFGDGFSGKVKVIYEAASRVFRREDSSLTELVRQKYDLSEKVILYTGSVKPHKNVRTLLEVYSELKKWGAPHQLVIIGRWDKKENYLKPMMAGKDIRYLGEVPAEDLEALYCLAEVLVHLSLYEGFGLTVLEAMQCGTPVVMSNTSSLPEVAGDAAITVSPLNVGQIADTVYNVLINRELSSGMSQAGLLQAEKFSWEKAARETLEVYRGK